MPEDPPPSTDDLLADVTRGDERAAERLLPLVYEELRQLADRFYRQQAKGHTLQPTALVHEAYLKLVRRPDATFAGKTHFKAVAAKAMRQLLIDRARGKATVKHGGGAHRVTLDDAHVPTPESDVDVVALEEALTGLARLDERMSRVVELRFFGDLTNAEVAELLGVARSTVAEDWRAARAWLRCELSGAAVEEAQDRDPDAASGSR